MQLERDFLLLEDAFMRNLPTVLQLPDRLGFEAVVNSCDAIDFCYKQLHDLLEKFDLDGDRLYIDGVRRQASVFSWAIVDNSYAFMQLLKRKEPSDGSMVEAFIKDHRETVYGLRNFMDHLDVRIPNRAGMSTAGLPIYGVVQFLKPTAVEGLHDVVGFGLGTHQPGQTMMLEVNPRHSSATDTISNITLRACDHSLNLSILVNRLRNAMNWYDSFLRADIERQVAEHYPRGSADFDAIMSDAASGNSLLRITAMIQNAVAPNGTSAAGE